MRRSLCRSETENTTVVRKRGGGGRRGRRSSSRRSNLVDETCSSPQLRERRQTTTTTTATTSITPPAPARTTSTITSKDSTRSYNSILNEHRDRLHKVIRKVYNYIRFSNLVDKWKYVDECLTDNRRMLLKQLSVYSAPAAPVAAAAGGNDDQDNAFHANNNTDEDEKELTNLPYIGDEEVQEDRNFFDELLDNYDGNYHGNFPFEFDEAVLCELVELTHYVWSDITVYCGLSSRQSSQIGANCSVGDADNADGHDEATTSGVDNELRNGRSEGNILTVYEVLGITESTEGDSSLSSPEVKRVKDCGIPYEVFVAIAGTFGSAGDTNKLKDRYVEMKRRADNSQVCVINRW
ncbi:unnamed protein product [Trichobilharzia regenti]|nr:unnamed protein product [Trichobilharzia regenti]